MKNIRWKNFTANNIHKYEDVLPNMAEKYNNTYHRSITLTHSDARNLANYQHIHNALSAKNQKTTSPKFHNSIIRHNYLIQKSNPKGRFQCAIPIRQIFGFVDDYSKVTYGMRDTM